MLRSVEFSTDAAGAAAGTLLNLNGYSVLGEIYKPAIADGCINGVEMIGLRGLPQRMEEFKRSFGDRLEIRCVHGRTGNLPTSGDRSKTRIILQTANTLMVPTQELLNGIKGYKDVAVLFHRPELDGSGSKLIFPENKRVWVENHTEGIPELKETVVLVEDLRERGVNAGVIIDFCHVIGSVDLQNGRFPDRWRNLMDQLKNFRKEFKPREPIPWGIHVAWGTEPSDSLPLTDKTGKVRQEILDDIAVVIDGEITGMPIERVVFECQSEKVADLFIPNKATVGQLTDRFGVIYEDCQEAGILG
jgi:hypothetical protein